MITRSINLHYITLHYNNDYKYICIVPLCRNFRDAAVVAVVVMLIVDCGIRMMF